MNINHVVRRISIRSRLLITMFISIVLMLSNLLIFYKFHYQTNQLNAQRSQIETIKPQLMEIIYIKRQFEKSISREDSQKMLDKVDDLYNDIYKFKKEFKNNPKIINKLNNIGNNIDKFSDSIDLFIETKNQEKNYNQSMKKTLQTLLQLIDSTKHIISNKLLTEQYNINNTKVNIKSYEYLIKLTEILINNDTNNKEKLLDQMNISNKLSNQIMALNLRDAGLQISTYSNQLYSKWRVLQSAQDFEDKTDKKLSNIISKVDNISKTTINSISEILEEKEVFVTTFMILFFFCSITIFFLLDYVTIKKLSYRFNDLISATKQIADGEFSVNIIPTDGDELDLLGKHFYHMSENLKEYQKRLIETNINLETANTNLEEAVSERTRELEKTRDKLIAVNEQLEKDKKCFELLATTDSLTGVKNRGAIMKLIKNQIKEYYINKKAFCVVLFDIDDFKKVNDQYGHIIGDNVLIEITKLVKDSISDKEFIGRYGGEEFIILLPNIEIEEAKIIIQNIYIKLRLTPLSLKRLPIRISAGLVEYKNETIDELLQKVDELLYKSKASGKDQFNY